AARLVALRAPPPPETTIVTGQQGIGHERVVLFTYFTQSRRGRYRCRLSPSGAVAPWTPCNGQSTTLAPLGDGAYTFEVAGQDETGAGDPTPAARSFTIGTTG